MIFQGTLSPRFLAAALAVNSLLLPWMFTVPSIAQEKSPATDVQIWRGQLDLPVATLRIRFELTAEGDAYTGVLVSPDQGNARLAIHEVSISDDDFRLELKRPQATYSGKFDAARQKITGTWKQGGAETPLNMTLATGDDEVDAPAPKETWQGEINAGIKLKVQVRVVQDLTTNTEVVYFDSLSQGVSGLKATMTKDAGKLILEVPAVKGRFEGELGEDETKATGLWAQGLIKLPLELTKTDEVAEPDTIKRPQHPTEPYDYKVEQVTFDSKDAGVKLAGTLTMPAPSSSDSTSSNKAKLMAAILISGSGPQDRDETLLGHKPFLVIADHLTKQGIAVLRFDDRGTGESTGDHSAATTMHFANDVRGAIAYLRARPEIDRAKIGLIGHSEGGLIGPLVTAEDHEVAFIVMLAGPGVNGEKIILNQTAAIARAAGESEAMVDLQEKQLPQVINAIKTGADQARINELVTNFAKEVQKQAAIDGDETSPNADDLEALLLTGYERMQTPWFRYFLTYEPIPALVKTTCPILSLIGEKDLQVDPKLNMEPLQAAIRKAGHPKSECKELPGLNHLFQVCQTGALDEYQSIEQTFAPSALRQISDWLLSLEE